MLKNEDCSFEKIKTWHSHVTDVSFQYFIAAKTALTFSSLFSRSIVLKYFIQRPRLLYRQNIVYYHSHIMWASSMAMQAIFSLKWSSFIIGASHPLTGSPMDLQTFFVCVCCCFFFSFRRRKWHSWGQTHGRKP